MTPVQVTEEADWMVGKIFGYTVYIFVPLHSTKVFDLIYISALMLGFFLLQESGKITSDKPVTGGNPATQGGDIWKTSACADQ